MHKSSDSTIPVKERINKQTDSEQTYFQADFNTDKCAMILGTIGTVYLLTYCAFSAVTLLVGHQEEHPVCKNRVMRCWHGYLSAAKCRLFAHGPADATVTPKPHYIVLHLNPEWFYLSGTGLPRDALNRCSSSSSYLITNSHNKMTDKRSLIIMRN